MKSAFSSLLTFCLLTTAAVSLRAQEQAAEKITQGVNKKIEKALEMSTFCAENPDDKKCKARAKAKRERRKEQLKEHVEQYQEAMKNPETKALVEDQMKKDEARKEKIISDGLKSGERKDFLANIDKYCKDANSEACKTAKKDYDEWKAKQK